MVRPCSMSEPQACLVVGRGGAQLCGCGCSRALLVLQANDVAAALRVLGPHSAASYASLQSFRHTHKIEEGLQSIWEWCASC